MSHNVQKYDKQVYLRVSEAQRCRVHSTMMVPVFGADSRDTPLAVFELVQGDKDVTFPAVLSHLTQALQVRVRAFHGRRRRGAAPALCLSLGVAADGRSNMSSIVKGLHVNVVWTRTAP